MDELHSLLKRQLQRFTGENGALPQEQTDLLRAINEAYWQFDEDRKMLEHRLELTSQELLDKNAELSRINADLERRVAERTSELSGSEARFRRLFEHAPVSIWEEDFSAARQYIDDLRSAGVVDFPAYFDAHPEAVVEIAAHVRIVDVNRATLEMYQAETKAQLLAGLSKVLGTESLPPFKGQLLALVRGETSFESETINYTMLGERRVIFLRITVAPGCEETWARVFVGISDITERRQAEAALTAERDLLQALMDNIPDTIYFKDTASRFTRINHAQLSVLGIAAPEDAIGKTDLDFFQNAELAQGFLDEEQRIIETGVPLTNHIEFNPTRAGMPRWFSATKVPIKNPDGLVIGIVGISRNITEQKQAEDALHQSEEKFRSLVERLPAITYISAFDEAKTRLYVSPQNETYLGFSPAEWLADPDLWRNQLHPRDRDRVLAEAAHFYDSGEPFISEYCTLNREGEPVWFHDEAIIVRDANGNPQFIQGVKMNITERRHAEQALMETEARYRQIVETAGDIIYGVDLRGHLTYVNPTALRIMKYNSEEEILGRQYLEFVHPAWMERVKSVYKGQLAERTLNTYHEFLALTRESGEIWLGQNVQLVVEADRVTGFQAVARDITAQKQAEAALQEVNGKMAQSLSQLQRRNREIALLNELSRLLQACQSTQEAYRIIAELMDQLFPRTSGALYLLNPSRTLASAISSWGNLPAAERRFAPDDCWALRRGLTQLLSEDQTAPRCLHLSDPPPAVSYCLTMHAQHEILGVLHVQSIDAGNLDELKRQLAYTVVEQTGMALSNLRLRDALREQSIRDPLTGLYNRRYMEEALKQHLSRVTRQLHPLGIIMLDIDHFKRINDTYGHSVGDALLAEFGQLLKGQIRNEDIACRYGGEEFIVIMPDASLEATQVRAEHLRQVTKALRVQDAGLSDSGITLSLGVAIYPQHGRNMDMVLRAADDALYEAKRAGRDQVVCALPRG